MDFKILKERALNLFDRLDFFISLVKKVGKETPGLTYNQKKRILLSLGEIYHHVVRLREIFLEL